MNKWLEKKTDELLDQAKEMSPKRIKSIRASYGLTQVAFSILLDIYLMILIETGKLGIVILVLLQYLY